MLGFLQSITITGNPLIYTVLIIALVRSDNFEVILLSPEQVRVVT